MTDTHQYHLQTGESGEAQLDNLDYFFGKQNRTFSACRISAPTTWVCRRFSRMMRSNGLCVFRNTNALMNNRNKKVSHESIHQLI